MNLVLKNVFAVAALMVVACLGNSLVAQSKESISTKYIAKDSFMVISLQPSKIASCADQKSETTKYVLDSIKKFSGLEVKKLDQIVMQMGAGEDIEDENESVIITFQFSEDVDADAISKKLGKEFDLEKTDKDGKPLYKPGNDDEPCLYFPNKKTLIMCLEGRLDAAIKGGKNNFTKTAKKLTTSDHIGIAFDLSNKDQKEFLDEMLEDLPLSEMGVDSELVKNVKSGEIHINLKSDAPMTAKMVCKDSKSAEAIVKAGKAALEQMTESLEEAEASLDQAPPGMAEAAEQILEVAFKAIDNTKFESKESTVTIKTSVKGGLTKAVDSVAKGVEQMLKMFEQFGGG